MIKFENAWIHFYCSKESKTDEFSEKFQTAVDPPFSESHVADFLWGYTALKNIHVVYFWKALGTRASTSG